MYAFVRQYCAVLVPNVGDPRLLTFCSSWSKQFIMRRLSEALLLLTCDYVSNLMKTVCCSFRATLLIEFFCVGLYMHAFVLLCCFISLVNIKQLLWAVKICGVL